MQIRALRETDDRSRFRSGEPDLDRFLQRFAGQNQFKHYLGVTYVALEEHSVLGYATVAPGHVEIEGLPAGERKRLPRHPLPVLRLARLAVDRSVQSQGLGGRLLRFVLELAARMADEFGCVGILVDAKPGAVKFYTKYGFAPIEAVLGASEARPQPKPMFLGMQKIKAAANMVSAPRRICVNLPGLKMLDFLSFLIYRLLPNDSHHNVFFGLSPVCYASAMGGARVRQTVRGLSVVGRQSAGQKQHFQTGQIPTCSRRRPHMG